MNVASLRTGWPAALLDGIAGVVAVLLAYFLRFPTSGFLHFLASGSIPLAATVLLQLAVGGSAGLYSRKGQKVWPVRLAVGAIGGAVLAVAFTFALDASEGVSREAMASQVPLVWFFGALWRFSTGLLIRREIRNELRVRFGDADMVEVGSDLGSMTGGVLRTWRYRHLLTNIVAKDLKLKYQRSMLGFVWSLLNPLIMIGVYTVAFTYVMKVPTQRFVLFLLIGILAWNFFAGAVTGASEAVLANGALQKSVVFPRTVLPFSTVLFNLALYLLTLVVFLPLMLLLYHVPPAPRMLLFPVFLSLQVVFITGLTLLLATASTLFRDVKHLIEVGINILFWATPIIYEATMVPERFQRLLLLSPMASFIRAYQDIFYYDVVPAAVVWTVAVVYSVGTFVCGLSVFLAYEDRFSDYL